MDERERERVLWMGVRQVLIMALGYVEDYLALPRSIVPRRRRVWDGLRANGGTVGDRPQREEGHERRAVHARTVAADMKDEVSDD